MRPGDFEILRQYVRKPLELIGILSASRDALIGLGFELVERLGDVAKAENGPPRAREQALFQAVNVASQQAVGGTGRALVSLEFGPAGKDGALLPGKCGLKNCVINPW